MRCGRLGGRSAVNDEEIARYWNANADAWTELARAGYDVYRDRLNTPAFLAMLPDVYGLRGLDIGCGEGYNTRLVADRGARMVGIDIADRFIAHAAGAEEREPRGIEYHVASAVHLPFDDATFDFATAFMSLMDVPETAMALAEAYRALKPGGFLQFSISHPCFSTPHRRNLRDERRRTYAIEVGDYFRVQDGEIEEWVFSAAPEELRRPLRPFRTPRFARPLGQWLNLVIDAGFTIERVGEPCPTEEEVRAYPHLQDAQVVAYFLHVRARKGTAVRH